MKRGEIDKSRLSVKRCHIAAATFGNALEFYDFLIYAFFSIQIGQAFFPSRNPYGSLMLSLAAFGAGFVTRPIGALVIGAYSDRVGRRPAMVLCFVLIGCSILAMACTPTYADIGIAAPILAVIARLAQGFSLGGEVGSNTAYLMEIAPVNRRAQTVSWQGASQLIALTIGSTVGLVLALLLPADLFARYGWRVAFLLGAVAVPFGLWLRLHLPETLLVPDEEGAVLGEGQPQTSQLHRLWRVILLGLIVLAAGAVANYIRVYIVTYAQAVLHMAPRAGFIAGTAGNILGIPVILLGGWLSDRYGRWRTNVWGNLLFLASIYPAFAWVVATRSEFALIVGMTAMGMLVNFTLGSFSAGLAESLPKTIRGSGFGTMYSVAIAAFGGTTQLAVTWLTHVTGSAMAPAWYLIGAVGIGQVALMLMRESAPQRLSAMAAKRTSVHPRN